MDFMTNLGMPGIDNKIFLKAFRSAHQGRRFKPRLKTNKRQKLIQPNDILLENAGFGNRCRLIAATIRPAAA